MSIVVFWLEHLSPAEAVPHHDNSGLGLNEALKLCQELREKVSVSHVSLCSEMPNMVGKAGVTSVVDGKTPDGLPYDWSKSGRAGKFKRSDTTKRHVPEDAQ